MYRHLFTTIQLHYELQWSETIIKQRRHLLYIAWPRESPEWKQVQVYLQLAKQIGTLLS